jgi:hypothetical protein
MENIYIEHAGEFYAFNEYSFDLLKSQIQDDRLDLAHCSPTELRDFEIGARVYFETEGWTEVVEEWESCGDCVQRCGILCASCERSDKKSIIFKKLEMPENVPAEQKGNFFDIMPAPEQKGIKRDSGKIRPGLIPVECIKAVAEVLTFGAEKYSPNG